MSDILLAKPTLPPGWIDLSVGEPDVVREKLFEVFDLSLYELPNVDHMYEYPPPTGYGPLVKILEDKHGAPVIITNGAKQALGATFYALKQLGKMNIGMRVPYWALIPPLVKIHGLSDVNAEEISGMDSYLCVAPNNPDGHVGDLKGSAAAMKDRGIPFIHDAAYYTHTYMPNTGRLDQVGDVQIHSISKSLGLSGLRLGYVVCPNTDFYTHIKYYMETMTVGVSIVSQIYLNDLLHRMHGYPTLIQSFEGKSSLALDAAKKLIKEVPQDILEVPVDFENTPGMFGWFKVGPRADFTAAKINVIDGSLFGTPGMVRLNLAINYDLLKEVINRLK